MRNTNEYTRSYLTKGAPFVRRATATQEPNNAHRTKKADRSIEKQHRTRDIRAAIRGENWPVCQGEPSTILQAMTSLRTSSIDRIDFCPSFHSFTNASMEFSISKVDW